MLLRHVIRHVFDPASGANGKGRALKIAAELVGTVSGPYFLNEKGSYKPTIVI